MSFRPGASVKTVAGTEAVVLRAREDGGLDVFDLASGAIEQHEPDALTAVPDDPTAPARLPCPADRTPGAPVSELKARHVRTPEGSRHYGLPIGAPITADAIARADAKPGRGLPDGHPDKAPGAAGPAGKLKWEGLDGPDDHLQTYTADLPDGQVVHVRGSKDQGWEVAVSDEDGGGESRWEVIQADSREQALAQAEQTASEMLGNPELGQRDNSRQERDRSAAARAAHGAPHEGPLGSAPPRRSSAISTEERGDGDLGNTPPRRSSAMTPDPEAQPPAKRPAKRPAKAPKPAPAAAPTQDELDQMNRLRDDAGRGPDELDRDQPGWDMRDEDLADALDSGQDMNGKPLPAKLRRAYEAEVARRKEGPDGFDAPAGSEDRGGAVGRAAATAEGAKPPKTRTRGGVTTHVDETPEGQPAVGDKVTTPDGDGEVLAYNADKGVYGVKLESGGIKVVSEEDVSPQGAGAATPTSEEDADAKMDAEDAASGADKLVDMSDDELLALLDDPQLDEKDPTYLRALQDEYGARDMEGSADAVAQMLGQDGATHADELDGKDPAALSDEELADALSLAEDVGFEGDDPEDPGTQRFAALQAESDRRSNAGLTSATQGPGLDIDFTGDTVGGMAPADWLRHQVDGGSTEDEARSSLIEMLGERVLEEDQEAELDGDDVYEAARKYVEGLPLGAGLASAAPGTPVTTFQAGNEGMAPIQGTLEGVEGQFARVRWTTGTGREVVGRFPIGNTKPTTHELDDFRLPDSAQTGQPAPPAAQAGRARLDGDLAAEANRNASPGVPAAPGSEGVPDERARTAVTERLKEGLRAAKGDRTLQGAYRDAQRNHDAAYTYYSNNPEKHAATVGAISASFRSRADGLESMAADPSTPPEEAGRMRQAAGRLRDDADAIDNPGAPGVGGDRYQAPTSPDDHTAAQDRMVEDAGGAGAGAVARGQAARAARPADPSPMEPGARDLDGLSTEAEDAAQHYEGRADEENAARRAEFTEHAADLRAAGDAIDNGEYDDALADRLATWEADDTSTEDALAARLRSPGAGNADDPPLGDNNMPVEDLSDEEVHDALGALANGSGSPALAEDAQGLQTLGAAGGFLNGDSDPDPQQARVVADDLDALAQAYPDDGELIVEASSRLRQLASEWDAEDPGSRDDGAKDVKGAVTELADRLQAEHPEVKLDVSTRDTGSGTTIRVSRIVVPKADRGQGTGAKIMQEILALADERGATVELTPSGDFGGSVTRLKSWYRSLGFVPNTGRNRDYELSESMYRRPGGSKDLRPYGDVEVGIDWEAADAFLDGVTAAVKAGMTLERAQGWAALRLVEAKTWKRVEDPDIALAAHRVRLEEMETTE